MNLRGLFWLLPITLIGCDKAPTLAQLCEQNPDICYEFEEDNHCKRERLNNVIANVKFKATPQDQQKYELLISYEKYAACMGFAAQIEHIKLKEKRTVRVNNQIKAANRIKEISDETVNSSHPLFLYYHWTRYLDESALAKFLKLEGTAALETPESQLNLATYYAKRNQAKTLALLFHALELYQANEVINAEIFKSLTSIFTAKKEYKQGYIWLKVLNLYAMKNKEDNVDTISPQDYSQAYQLDGQFLDKVAQATLEKIEAGVFKKPNF